MSKDKMPEIQFIGPPRRRAKFLHTAFRILEKHPDGTPKLLVMMKDHDVVNIKGGEEFMTAYVPAVMVEGRTGHHG